MAEAKRESDVWEIVNRERKRRGRVNENIKMEKSREYFARLLGGVEVSVVRDNKGGRRQEQGEEEMDISKKKNKGCVKKNKGRESDGSR